MVNSTRVYRFKKNTAAPDIEKDVLYQKIFGTWYLITEDFNEDSISFCKLDHLHNDVHPMEMTTSLIETVSIMQKKSPLENSPPNQPHRPTPSLKKNRKKLPRLESKRSEMS